MLADNLLLAFFIVLLSLFASAFFSLTETALTSISSLKAKHLQELYGKKANILNLWLNYPHRLLSSLLLANNLVIIFASIVSDEIIIKYFGKSAIFLVTLIMTVIIVLFAEVIPKSIAKTYAIKMIIPVLTTYQFFYFFLKPFAILMTMLSNNIQKLFLKENRASAPQITEEELEFLIDVGEQEGVIAEQKHEMLSGIFELGDTVVREIMVHRMDITAVSHAKKIIDIVDVFRESGLSRIPIFEDKIDNIIGIVHVKDALFYLKKHRADKNLLNDTTVVEIKRDVLFIPETKAVDLLFQELRKQKQQMAIVLDEYGGTSGIVTMEDIFEEIVGEVRDEFDNEEDVIRPTQTPNCFLVEAKIHIEDFCDFFSVDSSDIIGELPSQEFDTLGGFILHHLGHIPKIGEEFNLSPDITLEIADVSKRRVRRVIAKLHNRESSS